MKLTADSAIVFFAFLTGPALGATCGSVARVLPGNITPTTATTPVSAANLDLRRATERASELIREGRLAEALTVLCPAVETAWTNGNDDVQLATALNNLGSIQHDLGRRNEAAKCYCDAIRILEAVENAGSLIVTPLINLGTLRSTEGRLGEAQELYSRAVDVITQRFGSSGPEMGVASNGLAEVSIKRRRYPEAERHLLRALEVLEGVDGTAKHRAMALFHLSTVRNHQAREAEAESLLRRAITDWEQSVGRAHPTYSAAITKLAILISKTKPGEAEVLFKAALGFRDSQLGSEHPETGRILAAYARLLRSSGRGREAKALAQRAERIARSDSAVNLSPYTVDISALIPGRRD